MSLLRVATTQMPCSWNLPDNLDRAEHLVRKAAAKGAQVILRNISAPATRASRSGTPLSGAWALVSAGTSGSPKRPVAWP